MRSVGNTDMLKWYSLLQSAYNGMLIGWLPAETENSVIIAKMSRILFFQTHWAGDKYCVSAHTEVTLLVFRGEFSRISVALICIIGV